MVHVIADAFAISIVVFAISVSMGKILAKKYDYEINPNQVKIIHIYILNCDMY
jgi:hypothetical protein